MQSTPVSNYASSGQSDTATGPASRDPSDSAVSAFSSRKLRLSGWGRFPVECCRLYEPAGVAALSALIRAGEDATYIPRGLGRSYGDAALNRDQWVVSLLKYDRILALDPATGILDCEPGVSLDRIIRYILPLGFFLPVTPGTRQVTVGGAIAADVHGKNHHRAGSFSNFVVDFDLLTAEGDMLTCSRDSHPDIFWATVGGMGLTGFITRARIRMRRVESAYLRVRIEKVQNLTEALTALEAGDREYEYSAAWVDCACSTPGRALVMLGRHATAAEIPDRSHKSLMGSTRSRFRIPFTPPITPLRTWVVKTFNSAYFDFHTAAADRLIEFDPFFYPLDAVSDWNRLYGSRGFVQYQFVVPHAAAEIVLPDLLRRIRQSGRVPFLAVLKRFGPGSGGILSFPAEGATLALDLPADRELPTLLRGLDEILVEHGGRVYLAKDALLSHDLFARMYPRLEEFRQVKRCLDPRGRISSSLARRLKIVDA